MTIKAFIRKLFSGGPFWADGRFASADDRDAIRQLRSGASTQFQTGGIFTTNVPQWSDLSQLNHCLQEYKANPVLFAVINILASHSSNIKAGPWDKVKGRWVEEDDRRDLPRRMFRLIKKPNLLNTQQTFFYQRKLFREIYGNTLMYANVPASFDVHLKNVTALWNPWVEHMYYKLGNNYFEATKISDIIQSWEFRYNQYKKTFNPEQILLASEPNIDVQEGLIFGHPKVYSLNKPLSNIKVAYEGRNVIMRNRGMDLIISSGRNDATGTVPLLKGEREDVTKQIREYGMMEGQKQIFFTGAPIDVTQINRDVRKLGLLDEVAHDTQIVCHGYRVPDILCKLYLQGATFENYKEAVKLLYTGACIPDATEDLNTINEFLMLSEEDFEYRPRYDHIPELQESEKDKYEALKMAAEYLQNLFLHGGLTMNQWLAELDLPPTDPAELGDKYLFDYTPEELAMMGIMSAQAPPPGSEDPGSQDASEEDKAAAKMFGPLKALYEEIDLRTHGRAN